MKLLLAMAVACCLVGQANAQTYPSKQITVLVPYPAGSSPDTMARALAPYLKESIGANLVFENQSGANGAIALRNAAKSKPDGYTLVVATHSHTGIMPETEEIPFDPIKDFSPVGRLTLNRTIMVVAGTNPANTLAEFAAFAKANPGKIRAGSGSAAGQLQVAALRRMGGFEATDVPYRGTNSMLPDLISDRITLAFTDYLSAKPFLESKQMKALGVISPKRVPLDESIPAIAETFPGYDQVGWTGILAPAGTPPEIVNTLNRAIGKALTEPALRKVYIDFFCDPSPPEFTADDFAKFIVADQAKWKKEVELAGMGISKSK
jgi:tripartite-type tricarboxylate transporter receptor subunit TctC